MSDSMPITVELINRSLGGYNATMGLQVVHATQDEVIAELDVSEHHLQAYGLVHGGVLAGMIETLCSVGAALGVLDDGATAVGLENSTSFLRAVRSGTLRGSARSLSRGRRSHVWQAEIRDGHDRLVATGRVRLLILESGARADGEEVRLESMRLPG